MDLDHTRLWGAAELPWRGTTTTLRKVEFSLSKVVFAAKNEANYC